MITAFNWPVFVEWLKASLLWILVIGALVQGIVQYMKPIWQKYTQIWQGKPVQWWIDQAAALLVGVAVCFLFSYNAWSAPPEIGLPFVLPGWVGILLTGILTSVGADAIHKVLGFLDALKTLQIPKK